MIVVLSSESIVGNCHLSSFPANPINLLIPIAIGTGSDNPANLLIRLIRGPKRKGPFFKAPFTSHHPLPPKRSFMMRLIRFSVALQLYYLKLYTNAGKGFAFVYDSAILIDNC
jgi:hypothetical protein